MKLTGKVPAPWGISVPKKLGSRWWVTMSKVHSPLYSWWWIVGGWCVVGEWIIGGSPGMSSLGSLKVGVEFVKFDAFNLSGLLYVRDELRDLFRNYLQPFVNVTKFFL